MGKGPVIVIGGGVGPMAGVALHTKIIENTLTDGTDQSHLSVHHYSCSERIPDRTSFLLSLASRGPKVLDPMIDPAIGMAQVFAAASHALDGKSAIGGIPCNTFHVPAIFDRFLSIIAITSPSIGIVNMLDEAVLYISAFMASGSLIGVLSTTGLRRSGVFNSLLTDVGYRVVYVEESDQSLLHASIYDPVWGIKATPNPSSRAVQTVASMAGQLIDNGAMAIILGCTELPLALGGNLFRGVPLIDPIRALARGLIREAAPEKLKPL